MDKQKFPPFSLTRLLTTVFAPKPGERLAILIDLADPAQVRDYGFLKDPKLTIQRKAHEVFFQGLKNGGLAELGLKGGDLCTRIESPAAAIWICRIRRLMRRAAS